MTHDRTTRRSVLSSVGSAASAGSIVPLASTDASAADSVDLRVTGSRSGVDYRVEYDTGRVRTKSESGDRAAGYSYADGSVDGSSDRDEYSVPSEASLNRIVVENTDDSRATFELEHAPHRRLSRRVDGDLYVSSPNDTATRYAFHTPEAGHVRPYSNYTEVFQDEREDSSRYRAGERGVGLVEDRRDRWDFEGQLRYVVLELDPNAAFELTRDVF